MLDISVSNDKSVLLDTQKDTFHAILDEENGFVKLVVGSEGGKARTIKTKIKLINPDNSMLADTSALDVSRDASFIDGDIIDFNKGKRGSNNNSFTQQNQENIPKPPQIGRKTTNIFGRGGNIFGDADSSSPPSMGPSGGDV